jgi:hypothetical protein
MDAIWEKIKATNEQKVRENCENTLKKVFVKYLKRNIENREYETAGGHRRYKRDVEGTKDEYVSVLRDFKENEVDQNFYLVFFCFPFFMLFIETLYCYGLKYFCIIKHRIKNSSIFESTI